MKDKWNLRKEIIRVRDVIKLNVNSRLPRIREEDRDAVTHLSDSVLLILEAIHSYLYISRMELNPHYGPDELNPDEIDIHGNNYVVTMLSTLPHDLNANIAIRRLFHSAYTIFLELLDALEKYTQDEVENA